MSWRCRAAARFVLSWAYHPRALPLAVPAAALHMAALRGMEVDRAAPGGLRPARARSWSARGAPRAPRGGSVRETSDRAEALQGAQVLYVKEWGATAAYGDAAADAQLRRAAHRLVRAQRLVRRRRRTAA